MKCDYCGRENDDTLANCGECGTELKTDHRHVPLSPSGFFTEKRPGAILLASSLMLLVGAISLISILFILHEPEMRAAMAKSGASPATYAMSFVGIVIMLVCGIGVLCRQNWARWVYIIYSLLCILYSAFFNELSLRLLPSAFFALMITFLLTWGAGDYFAKMKSTGIQDPPA